MGNDDTERQILPPRHHYSSSRRRSGPARCHLFPVGSLVEVRTNEKHFKGVYFPATVVGRPRISPRKKTNTATTKNPNRLYVEYHDLLASEDGEELLRESVELSSVRPAPPSQEVAEGFQPNDVVNAFHMDGWWTGVVSRVAEGEERLVVTFENPHEELEFGLSELRAHWDWVDGVWVLPQRRSFVVGMKVEVWFETQFGRDDDFRGAWHPATIVQDLGNGSFLVEFKASDGAGMKSEVDSVHVRPCPPVIKNWELGLSEKVDAFHNFGWWSGLIKEKNDGYIVFLEHMGSECVFQRSDVRPRMDWKDGKWSIGFDNHKTTAASPSKRKRKLQSCDSNSLKKHANQETEKTAEHEEESDILRSSTVVDKDGHITSPSLEKSEEQSWPFTKRNTVWEAFESMEVFKKMPQNPHFKPLLTIKDSRREGLAIGCMVTFSNVLENISSLKMSDPKCAADDLDETLLHLETHGFDVGMARERLRELKAAKDEEEKLVQKVKDVKGEIGEREAERSRIEAEIVVMVEHMRRLQEQIVVSEIARALEGEGIALLKAGLNETEERIQNVRSGFEAAASVLSAPPSIS